MKHSKCREQKEKEIKWLYCLGMQETPTSDIKYKPLNGVIFSSYLGNLKLYYKETKSQRKLPAGIVHISLYILNHSLMALPMFSPIAELKQQTYGHSKHIKPEHQRPNN